MTAQGQLRRLGKERTGIPRSGSSPQAALRFPRPGTARTGSERLSTAGPARLRSARPVPARHVIAGSEWTGPSTHRTARHFIAGTAGKRPPRYGKVRTGNAGPAGLRVIAHGCPRNGMAGGAARDCARLVPAILDASSQASHVSASLGSTSQRRNGPARLAMCRRGIPRQGNAGAASRSSVRLRANGQGIAGSATHRNAYRYSTSHRIAGFF